MCEFMIMVRNELVMRLPKHYTVDDNMFVTAQKHGIDILVVCASIGGNTERICFLKITPDSSGLLLIPNAWKWTLLMFEWMCVAREEEMQGMELDHNAKLFLLADPNGFEMVKVTAAIRELTRNMIEEFQTGKSPTDQSLVNRLPWTKASNDLPSAV